MQKWKIMDFFLFITISGDKFSLILPWPHLPGSVLHTTYWSFTSNGLWFVWISSSFYVLCVCVFSHSVVLTLYIPIEGSLPGPSICGIFQARIYIPIEGSLPGPSICGIFQARILQWSSISYSIFKWCVCANWLQLRLTLCDPMDCSPLDSSVHGIFQVRILEWVVIAFSRGSSQPRDWTHTFYVSCICRWVLLPLAPPGKHFCSRKPFTLA